MQNTIAKAQKRSLSLAEGATIQRLLNAFIREYEAVMLRFDNDVWPSALPAASPDTQRFALYLPVHAGYLYGDFTYFSPHGYHQYGECFWYHATSSALAPQVLSGWQALSELLLDELLDKPSEKLLASKRNLIHRIGNSIERTAQYVAWHISHRATPGEGDHKEPPLSDVRTAEQALIFGHPFHPTPKSSEGMQFQDVISYAPELGAQFPLHYFALAPHLVHDEYVDALWLEDIIPATVQKDIASLAEPDQRAYHLFPCHPWQAQFLLQQTSVQTLLERRDLVYYGPQGTMVYPTSSVRTVCDPHHHTFYKLPLHVRITNFIRTNPSEQLQRSLDASRIIQKLQVSWPYQHFHVILERGYRAPHVPWLAPDEQVQLVENLAVLFRQRPDPFREETPLVIATLLEPPINGSDPLVIQAIRTIDREQQITPALLESWLVRYLNISMVPLLRLFNEHGVSLEAHVQNSLLHLEAGWPGTFYVRDMEGVSISLEHMPRRDMLSSESPVLLPDQEAWHRLLYYFFTNHLSHLIYTLACYGEHDERALWTVVRTCLEQERISHINPYIDDLLTRQTLPAKANLVSCLREQAEQPLYVAIPNPICSRGSK